MFPSAHPAMEPSRPPPPPSLFPLLIPVSQQRSLPRPAAQRSPRAASPGSGAEEGQATLGATEKLSYSQSGRQHSFHGQPTGARRERHSGATTAAAANTTAAPRLALAALSLAASRDQRRYNKDILRRTSRQQTRELCSAVMAAD